ncbi:MAG: branched-chain amino acid ABC transporter permease [Anaerolineales bacterium]|nr:branched-chain amino acid ABC transporter permease [Anaerolineales bacterium]
MQTPKSINFLEWGERIKNWWAALWARYQDVPLISWLAALSVSVTLEILIGDPFSRIMGLSKPPALFGVSLVLNKPALFPGAIFYMLLIYLIPTALVAYFSKGIGNKIAGALMKSPLIITAIIHLGMIYGVLHLWTVTSDYRLLIARLVMIAIIVTLSLNVVNGYMGEFSCSHPGFMALGAYGASVFTLVFFVTENRFGEALMQPALGPFLFPVSLILGGLLSSIGALLVAIPSFRTRGDYLAIISLAFMFIVKSLFENLEVVGGARGISNQPNYANLPTVFVWTMLSIWIINNFVSSTMGKGLNAVRDGELAASAMTVNTQKTKMIAFLFAAFWAGVGGGLFAHVIGYINPGTFDIRKLAEVLAMVYFGGLNSVTGSVVGAVGFSLINESLRPLGIYKWIIIPVMLILIMIYRPTGLIAFREFNIEALFQPKDTQKEGGIDHAAA